MHKASSTAWIRRTSLLILLGLSVISLSACEATNNWLKGRKTADADEIAVGVAESDRYVIELSKLVKGDPATQAEIFADSKAAAQLTPGPETQLRYALVVATPGHANSNDLEGQSLLREVLTDTQLLGPAEVALATVQLNEVEKRLVLGSESRQLRTVSAASETSSVEDAALARHVAAVEAENRRLRQSLEEAESKLEAITSIERSVRDQ
jgi:hypothetical protein